MEVESRLGRELETREARVAHSFAKNANEWGTRYRSPSEALPNAAERCWAWTGEGARPHTGRNSSARRLSFTWKACARTAIPSPAPSARTEYITV